ncbi:hypothetical protein LAZ67_2005754 [Cordylochernes scorpioides]|uniref:Reverse transcriptase domain-containing protein n=1 Tax=Cordylochernes scorpioides TaxID=51811 RepID=A0ABY6K4M5_9ARAC|nr:hypothetical protein LAZ67_2005754 [Cordylochernes scorpioides]
MRKVCAKLVPKVLTQDQKELRVLRCQELLDLIQNEPDFLNSVVTGDESWMFEYGPESKRKSCAWHTKSSPRPKKARLSKSRIKMMIIVFFDIRGIVYYLFSSKLGRTNLAKHSIDTENVKPIKHKRYRVSPKERNIINEQIQYMLKEGVIRPSSSPWAFPVILVKKRDGSWRFCVDYRKLNNVTVKDVYPIPRIDDVMDTLQGSRYFSTVDLRSWYWQVEIKEKDKKKQLLQHPTGYTNSM